MPLALTLTGDVDPGDLVAGLALLLSIAAIALPWWRQRAARMTARIEAYRMAAGDRTERRTRVVVANLGPADARHVFVEMTHDGTPIDASIYYRQPPKTLMLHAGEQFHIDLSARGFGQHLPDSVTVTWHDKRMARQSMTFWPTVQEVF